MMVQAMETTSLAHEQPEDATRHADGDEDSTSTGNQNNNNNDKKQTNDASLIEKMSSWIHHERQCVSIGDAACRLGISRSTVQRLLPHVGTTGGGEPCFVQLSKTTEETPARYEAIRCSIVSQSVTPEQRQCPRPPLPCQEEVVPMTVFKLYKEPFKNDIIDAANLASPLYAFRLAGQKGDDKEEEAAESLHASHERAMTVARNFTRGVTVTTNNTGLVAEITDDLIQPADQIRDRMKQTATSGAIVVTQPSKPTAGVAVATMKSTTNGHTTGTKTKVPTTKVATTAASFFRTTSESTSRETSKQKNSSAGTQSTAPPASNTNGANTTSEKTSRRVTTQQSKTAKTQASTSRVLGKKVQSHSVEKENRADKVGNADDFVGDQDDDDSDDDSNDDSRMRSDGSDQDDDDSVPRIPKPPTKTMKTGDRKGMRQETAGQKKSKDPIPMEEEIEPRSEDEGGEVDDDNTNKIPTVTGAMDAFAVAKTEVRNGATALNGKRRVKKLVEKTVIDNGYFRTIMEEVWEEIPVDDQLEKSISLTKNKTSENKPPSVKAEAPPTKKKKTTAVGNGNAMKQGTLMAFFGKK